jgi:DNA polymerase I-like protein with 3'-5' exonuclease and polymerase domains
MRTKVREKGSDHPEIVVVTDTPTRRAWGEGRVMGTREMQVLARNLERQGVRPSQVRFITPSGPLPEDAVGSERRIGEWLELHRGDFLQKLQKRNPRLVIYLGKYAGRQYVGRQVKINTARGTLYRDAGGRLVLPLYSPRHVLRRPEVRDIFDTDIRMVGTLKAGGWDASIFEASVREARYRWVTDLGFLLDDPPDKLAADVETVGVEWYRGQRLLTVQYAWLKAESVIVPMDAAYIEGWREQYERELEALDPDGEDYQGEVGRLEDYISQLPEGRVTAKVVRELKAQSRELLGNRRTKVVGHNLKFDIHALRNHDIHVANWYADTMQLAFAVDDNMESKDLDSCIRRWVPEMAGYADEVNRTVDKSRMNLIPPHLMRSYGCGDTDATLRLANVLVREARKDRANWNCFKRVQMPGLRAYVEVERVGFHLDKDALRDLERTLAEREAQLYREMIALVPAEVRRREMADPRHKGKTPEQILSFTRPDFIRECLFSERGLGLEPIVFTKTTARSSDPADRVASTSAKDHLGHFHGEPLVDKIVEFGSLNTMRTRYVGAEGVERREFILPLKSGKWPKSVLDALVAAGREVPEARKPGTKPRRRIRVGTLREAGPDGWRIPYRGGRFLAGDYLGRLVEATPDAPSGFWQYLSPDADDIHPSYFLHHAKTGRTNSRNPNGQNLPKHGSLAPAFRRIFRPTPGYLFLEGDLSQIELRLAAWVSGDPTMLHAYRTGQDLHALTAASTMGMPFEEFRAMKGSDAPCPHRGYSTMGEWFDHQRFLAKGINFGFLYGMWHTTFREYAKATFRIDVSPAEAERYRRVFFETYPRLENFHGQMKRFVGAHGYVRALHGALRRLPAIESDDEAVRKDTERQAINSPIQRFGSDLLVMSLARLVRDAPPERLRPCGTIHDSMILEVREDYVEEGAQAVRFYMESNPLREWFGITPPIPLLADVSGPSHNLASMGEMQVEAVAPPWYRVERDY